MGAAAAEQDEKQDGACDGDNKRAQTTEAIGKKRKHLLKIASRWTDGLKIFC